MPAWPRYLLMFQLLLVYTSTGTQKLSTHWLPGGDLGALYYILLQPSWSRFDMSWLAWVFPVTQAATLGTWLFEVFAPLLLIAMWGRSDRVKAGPLRRLLCRIEYRDLFAFFGVMMHLTIHAVMEVGPFSVISLAFYPALWHPDEWARMARVIGTASRRSAATSSPSRTPDRPAG